MISWESSYVFVLWFHTNATEVGYGKPRLPVLCLSIRVTVDHTSIEAGLIIVLS